MIKNFVAPFPAYPPLAGRSLAECKTILGGGTPVTDRVALYLRQGGRCFYCDVPLVTDMPVQGRARKPNSFTIDHILTRRQDPSRKGPKVAACYECNTSRGELPAHEFILIGQDRYERRSA